MKKGNFDFEFSLLNMVGRCLRHFLPTRNVQGHLLEQEYYCKFYDETDKMGKLKTVEIDKHVDGIDLPRIWIDNYRMRFVVCDVWGI